MRYRRFLRLRWPLVWLPLPPRRHASAQAVSSITITCSIGPGTIIRARRRTATPAKTPGRSASLAAPAGGRPRQPRLAPRGPASAGLFRGVFFRLRLDFLIPVQFSVLHQAHPMHFHFRHGGSSRALSYPCIWRCTVASASSYLIPPRRLPWRAAPRNVDSTRKHFVLSRLS